MISMIVVMIPMIVVMILMEDGSNYCGDDSDGI